MYMIHVLFLHVHKYRDSSIPDLENILDDSNRVIHESTAKLMAEQVNQNLASLQ